MIPKYLELQHKRKVAQLRRKWLRILALIVAIPMAVWIVIELGRM